MTQSGPACHFRKVAVSNVEKGEIVNQFTVMHPSSIHIGPMKSGAVAPNMKQIEQPKETDMTKAHKLSAFFVLPVLAITATSVATTQAEAAKLLNGSERNGNLRTRAATPR